MGGPAGAWFQRLKGKVLSSRVYPEFLPIRPGERVVNLGCGEGAQAIAYAGQYGEMVAVDILRGRLERAREALRVYGVGGVSLLQADVESLPLKEGAFDKAIAVDVIEHVRDPQRLCREARRVLRDGGQFLVTFPAMHDKYTALASRVGRLVLRRRRGEPTTGWDPTAHNQHLPLKEWIALVEGCGFRLARARASTLFPPLHLYGVPRFWFRSNLIRRVDSALCRLPLLRNLGQALVCLFEAPAGREGGKRRRCVCCHRQWVRED